MPTALALGAAVIASLTPPAADAARHARGPLFTVIGVLTYAPIVNGNTLTLRIPLTTSPDVSMRGLTAELFDVELPGRREEVLFDAFTVKMDPSAKPALRSPAVMLSIDERTPLPPGTYRIRLAIISHHPAAQRHLAISVRLAAPELATPPTIYIHRSRLALWGKESNSGLVLHETSGRARLAGLTIAQLQVQGAGTSVGGDVTAQAPTIGPGEAGTAAVSIHGKFPLGTATGQLQISSPQMRDPVLVAYEVQTKVWPLYLFLTIAVGVFIGFVTRVWLVRRIERGKALVQAFGVLSQLRRELKRHADGDFQKTIKDAVDQLEDLLTSGSPEEITEAVKAAGEALAPAQAKLEAAVKRAADRVQRLQAALTSQMTLPVTVEEIRAAQRDLLETIRLQLESDDAAGAESAARALETRLNTEIMQAGTAWCEGVKPFLDALRVTNPVLGSASQELTVNASAVSKLVDEFNSPGTLVHHLETLAGAVAGLETILQQLRPIVASEMASSLSIAGYKATREDDAQRAMWRDTRQFTTALLAADPRRAESLESLLDQLQSLSESFAKLIKRGSKLKSVEKALEEGLYRLAAEKKHPPASTAARRAGTAVQNIASVQARVNAELIVGTEGDTGTLTQTLRQSWQPPARIQPNDFAATPSPRQIRATKQLARDQALQTILLGLVIAGVGTLLLVDNFIGTPSDFLGAFAWGYAADITSAFVLSTLPSRTGQGAQPAAGGSM